MEDYRETSLPCHKYCVFPVCVLSSIMLTRSEVVYFISDMTAKLRKNHCVILVIALTLIALTAGWSWVHPGWGLSLWRLQVPPVFLWPLSGFLPHPKTCRYCGYVN